MPPLPSPIAELLADHVKLAHALAQATHSQAQQEQLLLLLQAELRHYRLLYGLQEAGFATAYFGTHLEKVILPLIGFSSEDLVQDHRIVPYYVALLEEAMRDSLPDFLRRLPELAAEMYVELVYFRSDVGR